MAKLLESKAIPAAVQRQKFTPEEQRIREQILAQYSQVELDECEDDDLGGGGGGGGGSTASSATIDNDPIMAKNTNALDVAQLAKERREQAKLDSKAKKDKDKEDRFVFFLFNCEIVSNYFFLQRKTKERSRRKERKTQNS